jgi:uncharacterized protein YgbK (DUF1537 family)
MDTLNSTMKNEASRPEAIAEENQHLAGPQVVILADDLTGACDSAAAFLGQGRRARVWLQDGFAGSLSGADVCSFSTDSRNQTAAVAADRVRSLAGDLRQRFPATTFFKKIDSAGRGHFAEETKAARVAVGADLTVCVPAFPEAGRCVLNGTLHVWDATGRDANVSLRELFPEEMMNEKITLISCGTDLEVERSAKQAVDEGRHVLLCDASSAADLQRIVRIVPRLSRRVLWAASAGLGFELARTLKPGISDATSVPARRNGKTLIFCGSLHPLTRMQMDRLAYAGGDDQADRVIAQVRCGESSEDSLRKIFCDASPVGSLVLTGGDTAAMVLRAFAAGSIEVAGQMSHGIPWGVVRGGIADGCIVITKSGGFGDEHVLVNALHFCRGVTA